MTTARDVASYILGSQGQMSSMKLQKLCYYGQAYSLAWFGEPLFGDPIEAWTNGPVIRNLWKAHQGQFSVSSIPGGNPLALSERDRAVIDAVLDSMGGLTGKQLSDQTHSEKPWQDRYDGDDAYPNAEITHDQLRIYYSQPNRF